MDYNVQKTPKPPTITTIGEWKSSGTAGSSNSTSLKRIRPSDDSDTEIDISPTKAAVATWPRFLVAHATDPDKPMNKVSMLYWKGITRHSRSAEEHQTAAFWRSTH